jgi:hypothetical protein
MGKHSKPIKITIVKKIFEENNYVFIPLDDWQGKYNEDKIMLQFQKKFPSGGKISVVLMCGPMCQCQYRRQNKYFDTTKGILEEDKFSGNKLGVESISFEVVIHSRNMLSYNIVEKLVMSRYFYCNNSSIIGTCINLKRLGSLLNTLNSCTHTIPKQFVYFYGDNPTTRVTKGGDVFDTMMKNFGNMFQ